MKVQTISPLMIYNIASYKRIQNYFFVYILRDLFADLWY